MGQREMTRKSRREEEYRRDNGGDSRTRVFRGTCHLRMEGRNLPRLAHMTQTRTHSKLFEHVSNPD
jgi:hypothetical protein